MIAWYKLGVSMLIAIVTLPSLGLLYNKIENLEFMENISKTIKLICNICLFITVLVLFKIGAPYYVYWVATE